MDTPLLRLRYETPAYFLGFFEGHSTTAKGAQRLVGGAGEPHSQRRSRILSPRGERPCPEWPARDAPEHGAAVPEGTATTAGMREHGCPPRQSVSEIWSGRVPFSSHAAHDRASGEFHAERGCLTALSTRRCPDAAASPVPRVSARWSEMHVNRTVNAPAKNDVNAGLNFGSLSTV